MQNRTEPQNTRLLAFRRVSSYPRVIRVDWIDCSLYRLRPVILFLFDRSCPVSLIFRQNTREIVCDETSSYLFSPLSKEIKFSRFLFEETIFFFFAKYFISFCEEQCVLRLNSFYKWEKNCFTAVLFLIFLIF